MSEVIGHFQRADLKQRHLDISRSVVNDVAVRVFVPVPFFEEQTFLVGVHCGIGVRAYPSERLEGKNFHLVPLALGLP